MVMTRHKWPLCPFHSAGKVAIFSRFSLALLTIYNLLIFNTIKLHYILLYDISIYNNTLYYCIS